MQRGLFAIVAAAIVCAACYFLLSSAVSRGVPQAEVVLLTASAALVLALAAALFGLLAFLRTRAATAEITRLALSVDTAIRDLPLREKPASTAVGQATAASRKGETVSTSLPSPIEPVPSATILPHPALLRTQDDQPSDAPDGLAAAIRHVLNDGKVELSLQPIISIARGEAAGFDVFVHLPQVNGHALDLRRPEHPSPGVPLAAFERLLVTSSVETAMRRLGEAGEATPLHVAISEALLDDSAELAAVLTLFSQHPSEIRSIVLSIPAALVEKDNNHAQALGMLVKSGVRIAVEGWSRSTESLEWLSQGNVAFLKLPADALLDPANFRRIEALHAEAATAGIAVIATEVVLDDDAVGLIDLGIVLMTGPRFSGPRRIKGGTAPHATRSAHL
jgi:cyclic-di-GMP phosphodiesterase TipF (flagellum assembly factor)